MKSNLKSLHLMVTFMLFHGTVLGQSTSQGCFAKLDTLTGREFFQFVDEMPQFPGGDEMLLKFLMENLKHPSLNQCVSGRVYVSFVVEPDGQVSTTRIVKGITKWEDREALSVIEKMPNWNPGSCKGEKVPVEIRLPINIGVH